MGSVKLRLLMPMVVGKKAYHTGAAAMVDEQTAQRLIEAGSAIVWEDPPAAQIAFPMTAQSGLVGKASDGDPDARAGKAPRRRRST